MKYFTSNWDIFFYTIAINEVGKSGNTKNVFYAKLNNFVGWYSFQLLFCFCNLIIALFDIFKLP